MQVLIVADDLTGALDSAATLAEAGLRCRVARRPADIEAALAARPEVLAVSTASREGGAAAAQAAVDRVFDAAAASPPAIVLKKIDSRLKGHIKAELAAVARRTGLVRALVAPSVPGQGRTVERGRLAGTGVGEPIDVAALLAGSGLALSIPDARSDAELDRALDAALEGPPALLVGAAGLAAALARRLRPGGLRPVLPPLGAPLLMAIGSRDPITLAQIDAVRAQELAALLPAPGGRLELDAEATQADAALVQLVSDGAPADPRVVGARFARSVADIVKKDGVRTLLGCGGETTDAILGELGVGGVAVEGELLPGMPVSTMVVNGRPMRLLTKSGGFGAPGALSSVVETVWRGGLDSRR